ncbi:hypothetical protein KM043_003108 [Ampulex compressa]|nr:hypothetical protein KM043_003108 [Ampulex compressa]
MSDRKSLGQGESAYLGSLELTGHAAAERPAEPFPPPRPASAIEGRAEEGASARVALWAEGARKRKKPAKLSEPLVRAG